VSEPGTGDIEQRIARLEQQDERLTHALELLASRDSASGGTAAAVKAGRNWDAYAAVIASLVGLLALVVSGYTAYVQRQQLRAQVWPRLEIAYSTVEPSVFITNQGTGPAHVMAMRVTVDGKAVKNWSEVQKLAGFTEEDRLVRAGFEGRVLSAGKDYMVIKPSDNDESRAKFQELLPGKKHAITMIVCYCSVLDDCWITGLGIFADGDRVLSSDACPISAAEQFHE